MKLAHLLSILALPTLGTSLAAADPPGKEDFAGNYFASLPDRAQILQLHQDGTAGMTLGDARLLTYQYYAAAYRGPQRAADLTSF